MKYPKPIKAIAVFFYVIILFGCSKSKTNPTPQPTTPLAVTSLSVSAGPYNTSVVITGTAFSANLADDKVSFNGKSATVTAATTTQLTAIVPLGAGTGNVTVSVNNSAPVSGPVFTYQLSAFVTTYAGSGLLGITNGPAAGASFYNVWGLATDASDNLYAADYGISLLRKITPDGTVSTIAGNPTQLSVDGIGTAASFLILQGLTIDGTGTFYMTDHNLLRKMTPDGTVTTLTGKLSSNYYSLVVIDATGNLYATDQKNNKIWKLSSGNVLSAFAGSGVDASVDGSGTSASFANPTGIAIDASGNLFVTETCCIRKITPSGQVSTIAGQKQLVGYTDGKGTAALFNYPTSIAVDAADNLYVCDHGNNMIRKITLDGTVSTLAGNVIPGWVDGQGTNASFNQPMGITIDAAGNFFVGDGLRIRKITMQ